MNNKSYQGTDDKVLELIENRGNYKDYIKSLLNNGKKVVFFGCGAILDSIVETWELHIGRKIDFTCDSDSAKWGKEFGGAICISPKELLDLKDEVIVFITIGKFLDVYGWLKNNSFPHIYQLYKYDLDAADYLDACNKDELTSNLIKLESMLSDKKSKDVYWSILKRVFSTERDIEIMEKINSPDQYFPRDLIKMTESESIIDVGAYDGDTLEKFNNKTQGKFKSIVCLELNRFNFAKLVRRVESIENKSKVKALCVGAWSDTKEVIYTIGQSQSTLGKGTERGVVDKIDNIVEDNRTTYIKMDIEGAEQEALKGAVQVIQGSKPKLAICVYHKFQDLWEIPFLIKSICPDYKLYLRHHTPLEYETVCYGIPESQHA